MCNVRSWFETRVPTPRSRVCERECDCLSWFSNPDRCKTSNNRNAKLFFFCCLCLLSPRRAFFGYTRSSRTRKKTVAKRRKQIFSTWFSAWITQPIGAVVYQAEHSTLDVVFSLMSKRAELLPQRQPTTGQQTMRKVFGEKKVKLQQKKTSKRERAMQATENNFL